VFLLLVMSPRLLMRALRDLGVQGTHIPFLHIFLWNVFQFCIIFVFGGCLCLFYWFFIPICLVASLYISRICMIGHLFIVWFSVFHNNSSSHVQCYSYLVHLNIDFWYWKCWNLVWGHFTWQFASGFSFKKREKYVKQEFNFDTFVWTLNKCIAHPSKNP